MPDKNSSWRTGAATGFYLFMNTWSQMMGQAADGQNSQLDVAQAVSQTIAAEHNHPAEFVRSPGPPGMQHIETQPDGDGTETDPPPGQRTQEAKERIDAWDRLRAAEEALNDGQLDPELSDQLRSWLSDARDMVGEDHPEQVLDAFQSSLDVALEDAFLAEGLGEALEEAVEEAALEEEASLQEGLEEEGTLEQELEEETALEQELEEEALGEAGRGEAVEENTRKRH